jgi:hypothetical protein
MSDFLAEMGLEKVLPTRLPRAPRGNRCAADFSSDDQRNKFIARLPKSSEIIVERGGILGARAEIRMLQDRINYAVTKRAELGRSKAVKAQRADIDAEIQIMRDKIKQLKPAAALK